MILSFKQKFPNNQPTYFAEKIIEGLVQKKICSSKRAIELSFIHYMNIVVPDIYKKDIKPKLHTIKEDSKGKWKAGNDIHFAYGVRTKNYFNFAPIIPCLSIQKIRIECPTEYFNDQKIFIDDRLLSIEETQQLAYNDGFDCVAHFDLWFDKDFTGKIIHWTDLKY